MNRTLMLVIGLVLGLAVGVAGGMLLSGETPDETSTSNSPTNARGSRGAVVSSSNSGSATPLSTKSYAASTEAIVDDVLPNADAEVDAANARSPDATGSITGGVYDDLGLPVAGVVIRAYRKDETDENDDSVPLPGWLNGDEAPPEGDLRKNVRNWVESEQRRLAGKREVKTGDDGHFVLQGIGPETFYVQAYAKGFTVVPVNSNRSYSVRAGGQIDFTATRLLIVKVDVRLPDGKQPLRARIAKSESEGYSGDWDYYGGPRWGGHSSSGDEQIWSPERPEIRLQAGPHTLSVWSGKHREFNSDPVNLFLELGREPPPLTVKLKVRTGVQGKLAPPKGEEVDGMAVFCLKMEGSKEPTNQELMSSDSQWMNNSVDRRFAFLDLKPGNYRLGVSMEGRGVVHAETVAVVEGNLLEKDLIVSDVGTDQGLVVRVLGSDGGLLRSAWVDPQIEYASNENSRATSGFFRSGRRRFNHSSGGHEALGVRRRPDGCLVVARTNTEPVEGAARMQAIQLHVTAPGFGMKVVPVPVSLSGDIEVRMEKPAMLEVTVTGAPPSDSGSQVHVALRSPKGSQAEARTVGFGNATVVAGRCSFGPIQPGNYELIASASSGHGGANTTGNPITVRLASGPNTATVALPTLHKLVISFGEGNENRHVTIARAGDHGWGGGANPDEAGLVTFEGLFAGDYTINTWSNLGQESMKVSVPTAGIIKFEPKHEKALGVKIPGSDSTGYLSNVGFRQGDSIIGVNGEIFSGERPASAVLNGFMMAKKDNTVMVNRAGETIEITVEATKFLEATNHGTSLER